MKILIVTYTYPPAKSVNGFRPYYFSKTLVQYGYVVHVLTRHFTGIEQFNEYAEKNHTPFSISREEDVVVFRTPFNNTWFDYYSFTWIKKTRLWKIIYLIQLVLGRTTQESYNKWFKPYLNKLLSQYQYHLVLVESGPTNLVSLVYKEATRANVPYAIDFRDAYYHEMYFKNQKTLPLHKKIKIYLERHYMKRSIQNSSFCISLSESLLEILDVPEQKREIIVNGYDEKSWSGISVPGPGLVFKIVIGGKIYQREFVEPFLQAIFLFLSKGLDHIEVVFIAPGDAPIQDMIRSRLQFPAVQIFKDRLSYEQTLLELASAQVVMYHGWQGYTGIPGTKIFDYLRSGKHILIVPADHDIIDNLLIETKRGVSIDDPGKAAEQLTRWYLDWKNGEQMVQDDVSSKEVNKYSRENQNKLLNKIIAKRLELQIIP